MISTTFVPSSSSVYLLCRALHCGQPRSKKEDATVLFASPSTTHHTPDLDSDRRATTRWHHVVSTQPVVVLHAINSSPHDNTAGNKEPRRTPPPSSISHQQQQPPSSCSAVVQQHESSFARSPRPRLYCLLLVPLGTSKEPPLLPAVAPAEHDHSPLTNKQQ